MMNYDEAKRPSNIVTEQIVIDTKYNTRLIPVTAEKDSIDEINKALETAKKEHAELSAIKQRAEEYAKDYQLTSEETYCINYIIKGEWK